MKLYWCPKTRAARAVWMLEETGCDYEKVLVDIRDEESRSNPEFLEASPMGKVPALRDGDALIADSSAICLYLADRYAPGKLAPAADDARRGRFLFWMFFSSGTIEPCMAEAFGTSQPNRVSHGWGDFQTMIGALESGLGNNEWLMGDWFTAADVMVGSSCAFMQMFGVLPESDVLKAYIERCTARPAYARSFADYSD